MQRIPLMDYIGRPLLACVFLALLWLQWRFPLRRQHFSVLHRLVRNFVLSIPGFAIVRLAMLPIPLAVKEYTINPARASVSMNATDEEFLASVLDLEVNRLLSRFRKLSRPIAGVIGGINDRLDFSLIEKVAESDAIGSVLLVGSVARGFRDTGLAALRRNPKCVFTGEQAHDALRVSSLPFQHHVLSHAPFRPSCRWTSHCGYECVSADH